MDYTNLKCVSGMKRQICRECHFGITRLAECIIPGPEVIKLFSSSTQLSMKFKQLLISEIAKIG